MLRITTITENESAVTLRIEGKLAGVWADELNRVCQDAANEHGLVLLDLSSVTYADNHGIHSLRRLLDRGIQVAACSNLVAELLHGEEQ